MNTPPKRPLQRKTAAPNTANGSRPDFRHVETWVFDLDNTLYAADNGIFAQVEQRMTAFIADYLNIPREEAYAMQKLYYREHGTTLNGLMSVHGMEPKNFLDHVHDIDISSIPRDEELDRAIARLPGRKVIYTNGSLGHAENVLSALGLTHHFEEIYDIVAAGYVPKPQRSACEHIFDKGAVVPEKSAMFEDLARNLEAPHAMGLTTVLVRSGGEMGTGDAEPKEVDQEHHPHVHHVTHDLAEFLNAIDTNGNSVMDRIS